MKNFTPIPCTPHNSEQQLIKEIWTVMVLLVMHFKIILKYTNCLSISGTLHWPSTVAINVKCSETMTSHFKALRHLSGISCNSSSNLVQISLPVWRDASPSARKAQESLAESQNIAEIRYSSANTAVAGRLQTQSLWEGAQSCWIDFMLNCVDFSFCKYSKLMLFIFWFWNLFW